ncbi:hypothetical protein EGI26_04775 [Lacihabitans sp. CCS-44]|nr:hypothetical protein [Lacihabitans sp. CCS-44]
MIKAKIEFFQRIIAQKVFFLILFFQKKSMPAWQGNTMYIISATFKTKTFAIISFEQQNEHILKAFKYIQCFELIFLIFGTA